MATPADFSALRRQVEQLADEVGGAAGRPCDPQAAACLRLLPGQVSVRRGRGSVRRRRRGPLHGRRVPRQGRAAPAVLRSLPQELHRWAQRSGVWLSARSPAVAGHRRCRARSQHGAGPLPLPDAGRQSRDQEGRADAFPRSGGKAASTRTTTFVRAVSGRSRCATTTSSITASSRKAGRTRRCSSCRSSPRPSRRIRGPDELIEPKPVMWPETSVVPFHYEHPVTGKRWQPA